MRYRSERIASFIMAAMLTGVLTLSSCGGTNAKTETTGAAQTNTDNKTPDVTVAQMISAASDEVPASESTEAETTMPAAEVPDLLDGTIGDFVVNKGTLVEYTGSDENIVIPDGVLSIADNVFSKKEFYGTGDGKTQIANVLKSIVIPEGVRSIGDAAFRECHYLETVSLPDTLESIGAYAFYECRKLKDINIPESLTDIGAYALDETSWTEEALKNSGNSVLIINNTVINGRSASGNVVIPDGVTAIADCAFEGKTTGAGWVNENASIGIKTVTLPDSIVRIGDQAFYECNDIFDINFPDGLEYIGDEAFGASSGGNKVSTVRLPESIKYVGLNAFGKGSWVTDNIEKGRDAISGGVLIKSASTTGDVKISDDVRIIGGGAFLVAEYLTGVEIPEGVTTICSNAFRGCKNLENVRLPSTLVTIGDDAFSSTNIKEIELPEGLETIGSNAFYSTELVELKLPDSVKKLGSNAFSYNGELKNITLSNNITEIPDGMVSSCKSLETLEIPYGVGVLGEEIVGGCKSIKTLYIPNSVYLIKGDPEDTLRPIRKFTVEFGGTREHWDKIKNEYLDKYTVICADERSNAGPAETEISLNTQIAETSNALPEIDIDLTGFVVPPASDFEIVDTVYYWTDSNAEWWQNDAGKAKYPDPIHVSYIGKDQKIIIPAEIDGRQVVEVSINHRTHETLTDIVISEGIQSVHFASDRDELENLILPETLEKLYLTSLFLETLTIPKRARFIEIIGCNRLQTVTFSNKPEYAAEQSGYPENTDIRITNCQALYHLELPDNAIITAFKDTPLFGYGCVCLHEIIYLGKIFSSADDLAQVIPQKLMN